MKCKNCESEEVLVDNDPLYSSYRCLKCGYYYWEDGQEEIEILPFCLLIVNDTLYRSIPSRKELLGILRAYRIIKDDFQIKLLKYIKDKSNFIQKSIVI